MKGSFDSQEGQDPQVENLWSRRLDCSVHVLESRNSQLPETLNDPGDPILSSGLRGTSSQWHPHGHSQPHPHGHRHTRR